MAPGLAIRRPPIPLTVIGGFLGAGKTTLLNRLLGGDHGWRVAVLVNDFGAIDIDAELIVRHDGDTISLANGCVCCSNGDGLTRTLVDLQRRTTPPERIIVEASGVADPSRIAEIGLADPDLSLDGVIVLADAQRVRQQARDRRVGDVVQQQLLAADLVVLNKCDLVPAEEAEAVAAWLRRQMAPATHLVTAERGAVPVAFLLGEHGRPPRSAAAKEHSHAADFASWSFATDRPFRREAFARLIDELPEGVIRAKGIVVFAEDRERPLVFHKVGGRWDLAPAPASAAPSAGSRLVLIGLPGALNEDDLRAGFAAALAGHPQG